jgi:hypothetical protein
LVLRTNLKVTDVPYKSTVNLKKSNFFSFDDSEHENYKDNDDDDNEQNTALVHTIMSLQLPQNVGNYLTSSEPVGFSGHCSMEQVIKSVNKSYRYSCLMI